MRIMATRSNVKRGCVRLVIIKPCFSTAGSRIPRDPQVYSMIKEIRKKNKNFLFSPFQINQWEKRKLLLHYLYKDPHPRKAKRTLLTMYSVDTDFCLKSAVTLARAAGEVIKDAWFKKKSIQTKSSKADLVTETDVEVEKLLRSGFKEIFPNHRFIGEESASAGEKNEFTDEPTWVIDPVDGTTNFVHSFPYVAVSIALTVNKEVVVGVVYNPILNQMFTAVKEQGAFCNDKSIHVSEQGELSEALLALEVGSGRTEEGMTCLFNNIKTIVPICHGLRSMGSAALNMCQVASGGIDAYYESGIHCWDMAAGELIVREAGGFVFHPSGGPFDLMARGVLCSGSQKLAESVSKQLNYISYERD